MYLPQIVFERFEAWRMFNNGGWTIWEREREREREREKEGKWEKNDFYFIKLKMNTLASTLFIV